MKLLTFIERRLSCMLSVEGHNLHQMLLGKLPGKSMVTLMFSMCYWVWLLKPAPLFVCFIFNTFMFQCFGRCQTRWGHPTIHWCLWNSWRGWEGPNGLWSVPCLCKCLHKAREVSSCLTHPRLNFHLYIDVLLVTCDKKKVSICIIN